MVSTNKSGSEMNAANSENGSTSGGAEAGNTLPFPTIANCNVTDLMMSVSLCSETNKAKIFDLAAKAAEELAQMASLGEPLWVFDVDKGFELLNEEQYSWRFGPLDATLEEIIREILTGGPIFGSSTNPNSNSEADGVNGQVPLQTEASRAQAMVFKNPIDLVHMLMDVVEWSVVFPNIISRATITGVLSTAELTNPDGALQVMKAEFHLPTPLLPTRECYFARHCRRVAHNTWAVVDVSLESIIPNPLSGFQRKPSGCLIQGMNNGYSRISWVEHCIVDNSSKHTMFRELMRSGFAFSANRWITTLEKQCDNFAVILVERNALGGGRSSLLRLAHRMSRSYNAIVNASTENSWRPIGIEGEENVVVRTSFNHNNPGTPHGVAVTVATSLRLPVDPLEVFDFLRYGSCRNQWDLLSLGRITRDMLQISTGRHQSNCVSIVLVEAAGNKEAMMYLQDSYTDSVGYYVVYAPINIPSMQVIMEGVNPDVVAILASGFSVLPDKEENGGSILSVAFQLIDEKQLSPAAVLPPQSVSTLHNIITNTVSMIKSCLIQADGDDNDNDIDDDDDNEDEDDDDEDDDDDRS